MQKFKQIIILAMLLTIVTSKAQVGIGTTTPHVSAILDLTSTSKGLLPPSLTYTQKNAISTPVAGLMIWCTDCGSTGQMQVYNGSTWTNISGSAASHPTTNGTAIVSQYTCSTASTGALIVGGSASGATQTITATVTTVGTYSIAAVANGVTFSGIGTFTAIGAQNIVLTSSGIPTVVGTHSFVLNTTPNCSFNRTTVVQCGVTPFTFTYNGATVTYGTVVGGAGKCWLDRNLGATQVATSNYDANSYGHLFQWGRGADGHQTKIQANTTSTRSITNTPGHANFITTYSGARDWLQTQTDNLWQGVNGINNPCPSGYRIPTITELTNERDTWIASDGAINSPLKIPIYAGARDSWSSTISVNSGGALWSSTVNGSGSQAIMLGYTGSGTNAVGNLYRSDGYSVRCIQNY